MYTRRLAALSVTLLADLLLDSVGATCDVAEVEMWLAQLEPTQEEAGFLSVDEFYRLCCDCSTGTAANGATSATAGEASSASAGSTSARSSVSGNDDGTKPTAREVELLAALQAARSEIAGLRRRLEMSGQTAPPPAARAGASGGIYDLRWTERVRPLYDEVCFIRSINDENLLLVFQNMTLSCLTLAG